MRAVLHTLVLTAGLALAAPAAAQDLLIHGGPIYTGDALVQARSVDDVGVAVRSIICARFDAAVVVISSAIRKDNPDMTQAVLDQARDKLRDYAIVDGGDAALYGLGALTEERWQAFFDVTSQAGVYEADLNWRDAFTDNYLPGRG